MKYYIIEGRDCQYPDVVSELELEDTDEILISDLTCCYDAAVTCERLCKAMDNEHTSITHVLTQNLCNN